MKDTVLYVSTLGDRLMAYQVLLAKVVNSGCFQVADTQTPEV